MSRIRILKRVVDSLIISYLQRNRNSLKKYNLPDIVFNNDLIGDNVLLRGYYEFEYLNALIIFLKGTNSNFNTAIDIGANIGNHTLFFSNYYNLIHSFEPNPVTYPVLVFNTRNYINIQTYNLGLGSKNYPAFINGNRNNLGGFTISQKKSLLDVQIYKLDSLEIEFGTISLIKIDVEGMEKDVILGAKSLIRQHRPVIVFEFNNSFNKLSMEAKMLMDFFFKNKYLLYEINTIFDFTNKTKFSKITRTLFNLLIGSKVSSVIRLNEIKSKDYTMIISVPEEIIG